MDQQPRWFILSRGNDESGVSGTGKVLEGVQFTDGTVVLRWTSQPGSTVMWENFEDFWKVHVDSHPTNATVLTWDNGEQVFQEPAQKSSLWRAQ
jgi:hypothetical protein